MTQKVPHTALPYIGHVAAVRGSVVDVHFEGMLPLIHTLLTAEARGIVHEVLAQLDAEHLRAIGLTACGGNSLPNRPAIVADKTRVRVGSRAGHRAKALEFIRFLHWRLLARVLTGESGLSPQPNKEIPDV